MNIWKIKLALTVDLMNAPGPENPLITARSAMSRFEPEAGSFKGFVEKFRSKISDNLEQSTQALVFENCTIDLNLISDQRGAKELIQGFNIYENLS